MFAVMTDGERNLRRLIIRILKTICFRMMDLSSKNTKRWQINVSIFSL